MTRFGLSSLTLAALVKIWKIVLVDQVAFRSRHNWGRRHNDAFRSLQSDIHNVHVDVQGVAL